MEVSDPNHKRIEKLNLKPWEVNPKPFNKYCLSLKEAQVQVVKKGWLFKEFDLNAMADQIIKEYHIEESQARESLKGALDRMKGKENGSTIQVPLIGEWKEKLFADADS